MRAGGMLVLWLANAPVAWAQDDQAPPPMDGTATATAGQTGAAPGSDDVDNGLAPPPMDGSEAPQAAVAVVPPGERPFLQRLNVLEVALMGAGLAGGWLAAGAVQVGSAVVLSTMAAGRPLWDLPRVLVQGARAPQDRSTEMARVLGSGQGAFMAAALLAGVMGGGVAAGLLTAALGNLSQDWFSQTGAVVGAGLLAAAGCGLVGAALFAASLWVPFPPLWLATWVVCFSAGVVVPPVAVVAAQLWFKQARPAPGGFIHQLLDVWMSNPLIRQRLGGL